MTFSKWRYMTGGALLAFSVALTSVPVVAQSQTNVQVQGAQQQNYARLAINLPETISYTAMHTGRQLILRVDGRITFDVSQILSTPLRQATNPRVTYQGGQSVITFDVPFDANVRDFRSGQYLVVDVYSENASRAQSVQNMNRPVALPSAAGDGPGTADTSAAQNGSTVPVDLGGDAADQGAGADQNETVVTLPEDGDGLAAEMPDGGMPPLGLLDMAPDGQGPAPGGNGGPDFGAEGPGDEDRIGTAPGQGNEERDSAVTDVSISRDPRPNSPIDIQGDMVADDAVQMTVAEVPDGMQLRFPWADDGVALAAFDRGGYLWLVFDRPLGFDATGLRAADDMARKRIKTVDVQPHPDALVLRMGLYPNQSVVVERDRYDWLISLKDTPAKPRFPLVPERKTDAARGLQVYIPATDLGRKVELEDPAVGDLLVVLPTRLEGRGLAQEYSYASSEVLETAQGVVISPLSDFVTVERFTDGVAIRSGGNDVLSASQLSRGTGIGSQAEDGFNRLIDFKAWRIGNDWEYRKNKARLFYELSLQPADARNDVRWKLARYYLAHGRGQEALGILSRMLDEDPLLTENPEYLAVRGVANFKSGRLLEAAADLSAQGLEAEQDAELWRALVAEARGQFETALEHYRRGKDVMGTYDDQDRADIQLAVVRASLELGNLEQAQRELDLLNGLDLSEEQVSESIYQRARIAEQQGQMDVAVAQYDDLTDVSQRWIAARARYSRTRYNLRNGDITPAQAIDQLERLRYAWRGDRFEIQLLDDLAELYFQTRQYENGLTAMKLGVTHYPDLASERHMLGRMGQVFRQLFLEGGADRMTPISAISLYYKFRDLTPLGADGDLMIRQLARRLVSVDLLGRAAELYEYQVKVRTEGAARAQIAAELAKIYILDERSTEALQILRATREPRLPDDIAAARRHVEARALTEMNRFEEAEVVIDGDNSQEAEFLRADIYWGDKNWTQLSATVRRLLGDGWRRNEALTDLQRLNLIRLTIAMTFEEDRAGLIETRRRYGLQMRNGDFANAFDLLTNDQELSGRELGAIASQIASVEKLQSFMRDYRSDFSGR
jgi:tetratricopeptide (TPR) repeat protein